MQVTSHRHFQNQTAAKSKRERTRSVLLDSAISVFAKNGFEATRITDITTHAGLANGTFYNYYPDKQELLRDVATGLAVEIAANINDEMVEIDNAIERVVTATMRILETARREPEWIEVLLDSIPFVPEAQSALVQYLRQDLEMGIQQGHFIVEFDLLLVNQLLGLVRTAILLDRHITEPTIRRTCESQLRLLGVSAAKAAARVEKIANKRKG